MRSNARSNIVPLRAWRVDSTEAIDEAAKQDAAPKPPPRRRRHRRGEREADKALHNHATERWMISYADFITLLFAFFVVMYATSSLRGDEREQRYRELSGALSAAFSTVDGSGTRADVSQVAAMSPADHAPPRAVAASDAPSTTSVDEMTEPPASSDEPATTRPGTSKFPASEAPVDATERVELAKSAERMQRMQALANVMDAHLQTLVRNGQVKVTRGARGVAIEINAAVLFDPAKADLKPASFDALKSLADSLAGFVEPLQIEGHSDDVPIATREFRSNWELSAARAASVARYLVDAGIAPSRIGIAGYAEFRPLVGNDSTASRARNRRVTLLVLSADDTRPKEGLAGTETEGAVP